MFSLSKVLKDTSILVQLVPLNNKKKVWPTHWSSRIDSLKIIENQSSCHNEGADQKYLNFLQNRQENTH